MERRGGMDSRGLSHRRNKVGCNRPVAHAFLVEGSLCDTDRESDRGGVVPVGNFGMFVLLRSTQRRHPEILVFLRRAESRSSAQASGPVRSSYIAELLRSSAATATRSG